MRLPAAVAGALGVVVVIWELPYIFTRTSLWPVVMLLAIAIIILAVNQVRHGG